MPRKPEQKTDIKSGYFANFEKETNLSITRGLHDFISDTCLVKLLP